MKEISYFIVVLIFFSTFNYHISIFSAIKIISIKCIFHCILIKIKLINNFIIYQDSKSYFIFYINLKILNKL